MKIIHKSKSIKCGSDLLQYTARYWAELIEEIESEGYEVDSADKHRPAQWITAYKNGNEYEIEVNKYSDGTYEIVKADLVGEIRSSFKSKKRFIKSADEDNSEDDLEHPDQEYDSAATSINSNKLPAIYKLVHFEPGKVYLDFGGGRFDNGVYYVRDLGATLLVYDPYNRSDEHNKEVLRVIRENGGADATLNSNVLNVIKEPEARLGVLNNIKKLTKPGGDVYITVYEGTGKGNEGPTKAGYQLNRKTADYLEEVQAVFPNAKRRGKLIHATNNGSVASSRLIKSNCKITSTANTSIGIEIDAENLKGKSREEIEQILDDAPVGSQVVHIRNLKNRFNRDVHIEKRSAYQANYYQGMGTPLDFKYEDTFWEVGSYKDPYIDDTVYKAVNGIDKYYGLTSKVLKAHGITSSAHLDHDEHTTLTSCPYCHGDRFNDKIGLCLDCGYDEKSWGTGPYYDQEYQDDYDDYDHDYEPTNEDLKELQSSTGTYYDQEYEDDFDDYDHDYEPSYEDWQEIQSRVYSASYGGAYDVLDEYYFTRDDLVDFGEEVVNQLENLEPGDYFVNDLYMIDPKTIHIEVYCRDREVYADKNLAIDMRRIHKPSDLNKYAYTVASELYDEFSEYDIESASKSTTGREFVQTHEFSKQWDDLGLSDNELRVLESLLISNPESGDLIPKSRGARKLRIQIVPSKGKRGGGRVIYVDYLDLEKLYMLSVYSKSEKSNLSPSEVSQIKDTIKSIEEEEHENV